MTIFKKFLKITLIILIIVVTYILLPDISKNLENLEKTDQIQKSTYIIDKIEHILD